LHWSFGFKKVIFALPLLAMLIYNWLYDLVVRHGDVTGFNLTNLLIQNLMVIFFTVFLSYGINKYERLKNKNTLQESEIGLLKGVIEGLSLGIVVFDNSGRIVFVNEGFKRITGYGDDLRGLDFKTVEEKIIPLPERKNPAVKKALAQGQASGEYACSLISKDGRLVSSRASLVPLKNDDGSLTGILWLFNDMVNQLELWYLQQKTGFFLDFTTSCVIAVDNNLKITIFNTAAEKLTGIRKGNVLGRHITEIFNDYEAEHYPIIKTIITGEEFHNYDVTFFMNGQLRTLLFDTARITDESGTVKGAIGIFTDISERKRIEEELKKTVLDYCKEKSFMRNVLNNLPVAIITYDNNLQPTYLNKMAEEMTGFRSEELPARRHEADGAADPPCDLFRNLVEDVLETGEPILDEQKSIVSRTGTAIPVSFDVHPIYSVLGEKSGLLVIARDIRERREHKQLLFLSRCILNSLNSAVVSIDSGYRVVVFNPPAEKLFGVRANEVVGRKIAEIPCQIFNEELILQKALEDGGGSRFMETAMRTGEEELVLLINSDAVRDSENNIVGAVAIFQDITELRLTQNAVRERERLAIIGQMAAGMAHEIKNPLTSVRGFAQLLKEKCPDNPTIVDYVKIILEEVDRANSVITDFLQLARPKQPVLKSQSVNSLMEEILAIVTPQAFLNKINVEYETSQGIPPCRLDRNQIKQVILNMCQNAMEAMPVGGLLKICTGFLPARNEIFIQITDSGCGIPLEKIDKIGVPFFTTKAEGTGLGLSISYSIIGAHKGRVEVESKVHKGATFRVYLPC